MPYGWLDFRLRCGAAMSANPHTAGLKPEVFFKPQEVWEIKGAEYVNRL